MLLKKGTIMLVLLVLLAGCGIASASAIKADTSKKTIADSIAVVPGYDVQPASTFDTYGVVSPMSVWSTIRQGQTNWHSKYVGSGCTHFYVDLNWGNSANSLRLRLYCPDGSVKGPYFDSYDGQIDGRICLNVYPIGGGYLPVGTYYAEVYGYSVSGIEDYTI
jgi:hypothetical protein